MSGWPRPRQVDPVHHRARLQHGAAGLDRRQCRPARASAATWTPTSPPCSGPSTRTLLTLAGLILLGGSLGRPLRPPQDLRARRGVVRRSPPCCAGSRPTPAVLVAARALQGIGGALLTPGSLALIQASFHPDDRARAVGLWSGLRRHRGGRGAVPGRLAGGRARLALGVPAQRAAGAGCVPVALRHVPESSDGRAPTAASTCSARCSARGARPGDVRPDRGPAGPWWSCVPRWRAWRPGVAFVCVEQRAARTRCCRSTIFASRQFTAVNLVTLCVYAAFGGFFFLARSSSRSSRLLAARGRARRCCRRPS